MPYKKRERIGLDDDLLKRVDDDLLKRMVTEWLTKPDGNLPNGVASLITLARFAHSDGNRQLEHSALNKLATKYGLTVGFTCEQSVERDLRRIKGSHSQ